MDHRIKQQKRAGKTEYAGRRRSVRQRSGFKSGATSTGGRVGFVPARGYTIDDSNSLTLRFLLPQCSKHYVGFGFYFTSTQPLEVTAQGIELTARTLSNGEFPDWRKIGAIFRDNAPELVEICIRPTHASSTDVYIYDEKCGTVWNEYFEGVREAVLSNITQFAPEALTIIDAGEVVIDGTANDRTAPIALKECNRCARFLPINLNDERKTLSFSNHCVSKAPCRHGGFGILKKVDLDGDIAEPIEELDETLELTYGFQLECRLCKKFVVNAALNPLRSVDQMKEDGQRRREIEHLISELYQMSAQMQFRHRTGIELATFVWDRFDQKCFNCGREICNPRTMHLDHTRPLAHLWPLDETATCLCKECNSQKRDRSPCDFYDADQVVALSQITGIALEDLREPRINTVILDDLLGRLDWFYDEFLAKEWLQKEKAGKVSAELICKTLDKAVRVANYTTSFNFQEEYWARYA